VVAASAITKSSASSVPARKEAGKHVYCEWPLGRTTAEAVELAALAKAATASRSALACPTR
jgi:hypothetical protein